MSSYRAALIGCGRPGPPPGVAEGYAIAYAHAKGYQAAGNVTLAAAADINPTNLEAFTATFGVPAAYGDYREMLAHTRPDIVSVCTWPGLHVDMVVAAAEAGARGILCEKPMALGLGDADRMIEACVRSGTILSICHQRRLAPPFTTACSWLRAGAIGRLVRIDAWVGGGWDLLSWGTHWVDMFFYMVGDAPAGWVFAGIDCTRRQRRYGHPVEDRSLTMVGFDDGVTAVLHIAPEVQGAGVRLIGANGQIDISDGAPVPRLIGGDEARAAPPDDGAAAWTDGFAAAVRDLVTAIEAGAAPQLDKNRGRAATEVIMAAYASGVERRLVALPYTDPEFPLNRLFAASAAL